MISEFEIKQILKKEVYDVGEAFEIIQAYIFERKGFLLDIFPLINVLQTQKGFFYYKNYFLHLRDTAFDFYTIKFNYEEYLLFNSKL